MVAHPAKSLAATTNRQRQRTSFLKLGKLCSQLLSVFGCKMESLEGLNWRHWWNWKSAASHKWKRIQNALVNSGPHLVLLFVKLVLENRYFFDCRLWFRRKYAARWVPGFKFFTKSWFQANFMSPTMPVRWRHSRRWAERLSGRRWSGWYNIKVRGWI